jgi:hypothetical protein
MTTQSATLPPGPLKLLRTIAREDLGAGVKFEHAPYGRWRMEGSTYAVNDRTFHVLDARGLIDVGNGQSDPVRITEAGRRWLADHRTKSTA